MVSATPCACDSGSSLLTQSYENYDIPKNISQVSIMNLYTLNSRYNKIARQGTFICYIK